MLTVNVDAHEIRAMGCLKSVLSSQSSAQGRDPVLNFSTIEAAARVAAVPGL